MSKLCWDVINHIDHKHNFFFSSLVPSIKTSFIIPIGCLTKTNRKTTLKYIFYIWKTPKKNQQTTSSSTPFKFSKEKNEKKIKTHLPPTKYFLHQGCSILYKVVCFRFKTNHPFNCKGRNEDKRGLQYVQTLTNTI